MTEVPPPSFGPFGFTSPEELAILAGVLADMNAAFGGNLNTSVSTPQGQWATSLAAVIGASNDLFVDFTNQVDPAFSSGRMQDAIARIYYLTRRGATPTTVTARCFGATGVTIPAGALARATDGTIYAALSSGVVGTLGYVDLQFAALTPGPVDLPIGALSTIYRTIPGWDSVTNLAAGTTGRDEETREQMEDRRAQSVAANATGILPAVRGSVLAVPSVVDAYVTENETGTAATIGGVLLAPNSLYVCVQGGSDLDVATAIWLKKPPGCNYTGTTSVVVSDTNSGYLTPPTYTVKFERAVGVAIDFDVTLATGPGVPGDAGVQVEAAIAALFPSLARIGQPIYASSFTCAISALGPWVRLLSIEVGGAAFQTIDIDQIPTLGTVTTLVT